LGLLGGIALALCFGSGVFAFCGIILFLLFYACFVCAVLICWWVLVLIILVFVL